MNKKNIVTCCLLVLFYFQILAQKAAPQNWFNLDYKKDKVYGVSTEKAYTELLKNKVSAPVIVAVIDGGTDINHEDLKAVIWANAKETNDGKDDDNNGYIDDINGWSFIGGATEDVKEDNLEITRLYAQYKKSFERLDTSKGFSDAAFEKDYRYYLKLKAAYMQGSGQFKEYQNMFNNIIDGLKNVKNYYKKDTLTIEELNAYNAQYQNDIMAKSALLAALKRSNKKQLIFTKTFASIYESKEEVDKFIDYNYNLSFDPRYKVGDNYLNTNEKFYGCNRVVGPKADHGTHVAGIIAAMRNNQIGINGVANNVQIMVLRVVPDGDERDKDVANAIRYASDNGAKIINMSFGKAFTSDKKAVDEAVKYAASKDVLLIHAAGNDAKNIDIEDNFPTAEMSDGSVAQNWIEVGASSWKKRKHLTADFSNYGKKRVDVFAPGVDIYSCTPDSKYASFSGTSMAAPVTSGVAALLKSYYPNLSALQIKNIILESSIKYNKKVWIPNTKNKTKLITLCKTGGIVNAYEAIKMAELLK